MMEQWLISHETVVIGVSFYGMLALVAVWESFSPAKPPTTSTPIRWLNNFALLALDNLFIRLVFPLLAVSLSFTAAKHGWGLFNLVSLPMWLMLLVSLIVLDFAAYVVHRLLHEVPWLWRLHKIHHADLDYDVTTALRFHPLEAPVTLGTKMVVVASLGIHPVAVITYEALFMGTAFINHGNIHLPKKLDYLLRPFIVTPDMHRIHHSIDLRESNSNFAGIFSVWDHLFGTYCKDPAAGQQGMIMGLAEYRDSRALNLPRLLVMPFLQPPSRIENIQAGNTLESDTQRS